MNKLTNVTADAYQKKTVVLSNGLSFTMILYYIPQQFGWFINDLTYPTFQVKCIRITNSPNMLYQFQNLIPFGLACFSSSQREPSQLQDFATGASSLYLLSQAECIAYADYIKGGSLPS